jgi:sterol desaturase/sphingolipid hydroxylase (fatty acid hydroxylase superfamily)
VFILEELQWFLGATLFSTASAFYFPYVVTYLIFAVMVFRYTRCLTWKDIVSDGVKVLRFIFPVEIYGHRSTKMDLKIWFFALVLERLGAFALISTVVMAAANTVLDYFFMPTREPDLEFAGSVSVLMRVSYTVAVIFTYDFALFAGHYLTHKIPFLWNFHKVHHSAEVLTPITAYRFHPIDTILNICLGVVFGTIVTTLFAVLTGNIRVDSATVFYSSLIYIFFSITANARHSHLKIGFGPAISEYLISPVMHHAHHSCDVRHHDKNFGFIFSIWDRALGSYYLPDKDEKFTYGVSGQVEEAETLGQILLQPFLELLGRSRK